MVMVIGLVTITALVCVLAFSMACAEGAPDRRPCAGTQSTFTDLREEIKPAA